MRREVHILAAVLVAGAVAACGDDAPTVPSPAFEPQFLIAAGTEVSCDFQDLRTKAAPAYFVNGSTTLRTVKGLIQDMESAGEGTAGANAIGFQIFEIVASQIEAKVAGNPSDIDGGADNGSDFVNKTLACMEPAPFYAIDFTGALEDTSGGGAFCVRGGPNDDPSACVTFDGFSGLSPNANSSFTTWFGLEPRRLVYAAPLSIFYSNEVVVGGVYEWSTVPYAALDNSNGKGVVGMCVPNPVSAPVNRVQHREQGNTPTILLLANPFFLDGFLPCDNFAALDRGSMSPLFAFARSVFDWASPEPLYASALKAGGGTSGSLGDLSKFAVVNAGAVNLFFTPPIADQTLSTPFDLTVQALGNQGTPFIDLEIRISVQGNSTSLTGVLTGLQCSTSTAYPQGSCTATTDQFGNAVFTGIQLNKSGGYRLLAESAALPAPNTPDA
ncbi:MAG TPA: hypothetical protein VK845_02030, partial [Gemmatimonadales bacterium]|nr:hypothetical protein [Gemmatimonadales bacterium]